MFQHILVPLDGSQRAEQALPVAAQLARSSGGTLVVLRVVLYPVELRSSPADTDAYADSNAMLVEENELEFDLKEAKDYLTHVVALDDLEGVGVQTEAIVGTPASTILSLAQGRAIDLVVMCSHGDTGFRRWRFGSVAQKVARHSPAPVLVLNAKGVIPEAEQEKTPFGTTGWLPAGRVRPATRCPALYRAIRPWSWESSLDNSAQEAVDKKLHRRVCD